MLELKGRYCKDCVIYTDNIDQDAYSIIYSFLDHPMFEGSKIRIMPDVHAGKDIVVGFTVPFTDHVNPDHVGGDIGCTVSTTITDIPVNPADYPEIESQIRQRVKFGMTAQEKPLCSISELVKHIQSRYQKAQQDWPQYVGGFECSEKGLDQFLRRIEMDGRRFYCQIGTVGSGNHFVEIGRTPEGNYAITAHCGSRNLGQKVWKYWKTVANIPSDVPNGYLTGDNMRGYITDMVIAQAYAEFNHMMIQREILDIIRTISGGGKMLERIITTHNYIDFSSKMMRKGAVRAMAGEKLVIPFNMRDGLIIAHGKSNPEWNCSAPHGAGRLLKRSEAKELIDLNEYKESMKDIYSSSVVQSTLDESPMAYKPTEEILALIGDTVEIDYFIRPVINMKDRGEAFAHDEEPEPED